MFEWGSCLDADPRKLNLLSRHLPNLGPVSKLTQFSPGSRGRRGKLEQLVSPRRLSSMLVLRRHCAAALACVVAGCGARPPPPPPPPPPTRVPAIVAPRVPTGSLHF